MAQPHQNTPYKSSDGSVAYRKWPVERQIQALLVCLVPQFPRML